MRLLPQLVLALAPVSHASKEIGDCTDDRRDQKKEQHHRNRRHHSQREFRAFVQFKMVPTLSNVTCAENH